MFIFFYKAFARFLQTHLKKMEGVLKRQETNSRINDVRKFDL